VIDENLTILAGEGRYRAALLLNLAEVPVVQVEGLSEARKRAYLLADNKIAIQAGWDRAKLVPELGELQDLLIQDGIDISITGFDAGEIDVLTDDFAEPVEDLDQIGTVGVVATSEMGDTWILGNHRLSCGDARDPESARRLLYGKSARVAFLDVPYNVRVRGIGGRGKAKHREFAMASGEMSPTEFRTFLNRALSAGIDVSAEGALHYICIDWRHVDDVITVVRELYGTLLNIAVWVKPTPGQGSFYRSQHELIVVARVGHGSHLNNIKLGKHGRTRSNVWRYAGVNNFKTGRGGELDYHPTVKPVALVADAIKDSTRRGDIVLDTFSGSGTTILAAERTGRIARCMDIDPLYVDVAVRRWQQFTGQDAVHAESGLTFADASETKNAMKSVSVVSTEASNG
jgi:DNA modification methylase